MKKIIFSVLLLALTNYGIAGERVTLSNGKVAILEDDGTWSYVASVTQAESEDYKNIDYIDLKLDINSLVGQKIKTRAVAQLVADMFMIKQEIVDMSALFVNIDNISREERKYILTSCATGCNVTVFGRVGEVMFERGVIAEKIEW